MRQKFTLITLGVRDFKKALSFYENLGWEKSDKSKGIIQLFIVSWNCRRINFCQKILYNQ